MTKTHELVTLICAHHFFLQSLKESTWFLHHKKRRILSIDFCYTKCFQSYSSSRKNAKKVVVVNYLMFYSIYLSTTYSIFFCILLQFHQCIFAVVICRQLVVFSPFLILTIVLSFGNNNMFRLSRSSHPIKQLLLTTFQLLMVNCYWLSFAFLLG